MSFLSSKSTKSHISALIAPQTHTVTFVGGRQVRICGHITLAGQFYTSIYAYLSDIATNNALARECVDAIEKTTTPTSETETLCRQLYEHLCGSIVCEDLLQRQIPVLNIDESHNQTHINRVLAIAEVLARRERVFPWIWPMLRLSAQLHDVRDRKYMPAGPYWDQVAAELGRIGALCNMPWLGVFIEAAVAVLPYSARSGKPKHRQYVLNLPDSVYDAMADYYGQSCEELQQGITRILQIVGDADMLDAALVPTRAAVYSIWRVPLPHDVWQSNLHYIMVTRILEAYRHQFSTESGLALFLLIQPALAQWCDTHTPREHYIIGSDPERTRAENGGFAPQTLDRPGLIQFGGKVSPYIKAIVSPSTDGEFIHHPCYSVAV